MVPLSCPWLISLLPIGLSYAPIAHRFLLLMSDNSPIVIPTVQVRPNMILIYDTYQFPNGRKSPVPDITMAPRSVITPLPVEPFSSKKAYSGELCPNSKKRLSKAINLLCAIAQPKIAENFKTGQLFQFRVNFVTLTLPAPQGIITDKQLKSKCLDPWIKSMKRKYGLRSYVWRAERQFNGNLHFHVTTDTYLPYDDLCHVWNRQLDRLGFIDRFRALHGHSRPNSTDVHSVQKIINLAAYMVKYMSKSPADHLKQINEQRLSSGKRELNPSNHRFRQIEGQPEWNQPIEGKVWDCSTNLKLKARCETEISNDQTDCLQSLIDTFPDQCKRTDFCFIIFTNNIPMDRLLSGILLVMWLNYLNYVRDYLPDLNTTFHHPPLDSHSPSSTVISSSKKFSKSPYSSSDQLSIDFPPYWHSQH